MVKKFLLIMIFIVSSYSLDLSDIFLEKKDFKGQRVTVKGVIERKSCKKAPCQIVVKSKIGDYFVYLSLTFQKRYAPLVNKKWVTTPLIVSCVAKTPFIYTDCIN